MNDAERRAVIQTRLQHNADRLIAAVTTQTFHYMIENGLEYRYITTGEIFVFLRILTEDLTTLYYYITVPVDEIADKETIAEWRTAIAQVMILSLLALQSERRDRGWPQEAKA